MTDQLSLFAPPASDDKNVAWLETFLQEHPGWHTASHILTALGLAQTDEQKRRIRSLAQASQWVISGQKGYKHLSRATTEEINHFTNWMESQAREMTRRAESVRRNAHRLVG